MEMTVSRRRVFQMLGLGGVALTLPMQAFAAEPKDMVLSSEIGNNHGHDLVLNPGAALVMLRQTLPTVSQSQPVIENIQGTSRHPHSLAITHADLLQLFHSGAVVLNSSVDAGHSHQVTIKLDIA